MSFRRVTGWVVMSAALTGALGCSSNDDGSYRVCAEELTKADLVKFLDGNLVVVASKVERGVSAGSIIGGLVLTMVLNGIDFANPTFDPSFSDGRYELRSGDALLGFSLFFTEDFGESAAGDAVPHNVFDPESYVQNLTITNVDIATGEVSYDYEPGPLAELADGDLEINADNPTNVRIRVRIRADLLAFEAFSEGTHNGRPPRQADELRLVMTTTRAPLLEVYDQFLAGEFGFRYTGTEYHSVYYGIDQTFTDSLFLMGSDGEDGWVWTGDYESTVIKPPTTMYQSGFVSNLAQNYTEYYCDQALTERAGVARHRRDLLGGEFVFEDGTKVGYGLGAF